MADWDIVPSSVNRVLGSTDDAGDEISGAWNGYPGCPAGVFAIGQGVGRASQSGLVSDALGGFLDDRSLVVEQVMDRVLGVLSGTAQACQAILDGDQAMSQAIRDEMVAACGSGDFGSLLTAGVSNG